MLHQHLTQHDGSTPHRANQEVKHPVNVVEFWNRVNKTGDCLLWTGAKTGQGYGNVFFEGRNWSAHRLSWVLLNGPVPVGLELDHLCRTPLCVKPTHLEPVTHTENMRRSPISQDKVFAAKTHCPHGHPYSPENTWITSNGGRACRVCQNKRSRERLRRVRAAAREMAVAGSSSVHYPFTNGG